MEDSFHVQSTWTSELPNIHANSTSSLVPAYRDLSDMTFICSIPGSVAGQTTVSGDAYVQASFQYSYSHIWRNLGIVIAFYVFFLTTYLVATELNSSSSSKAEVLLFSRRSRKRASRSSLENEASERPVSLNGNSQQANLNAARSRDIFTWRNVNYDIRIKDEPRKLLDNVCGWVKPGTLTALMGTSGAGKTTLLDVLAQRTSTGVITGEMFVNGAPPNLSFQRKSGKSSAKRLFEISQLSF